MTLIWILGFALSLFVFSIRFASFFDMGIYCNRWRWKGLLDVWNCQMDWKEGVRVTAGLDYTECEWSGSFHSRSIGTFGHPMAWSVCLHRCSFLLNVVLTLWTLRHTLLHFLMLWLKRRWISYLLRTHFIVFLFYSTTSRWGIEPSTFLVKVHVPYFVDLCLGWSFNLFVFIYLWDFG